MVRERGGEHGRAMRTATRAEGWPESMRLGLPEAGSVPWAPRVETRRGIYGADRWSSPGSSFEESP